MGIVNRVEQLIDLPTTSDEKAVDLLQSLRQLVDYKDMGTRFKVLAIHDPKKEANTIGFPPFP
jgi:SAM-dependent MidA family methyltransferase